MPVEVVITARDQGGPGGSERVATVSAGLPREGGLAARRTAAGDVVVTAAAGAVVQITTEAQAGAPQHTVWGRREVRAGGEGLEVTLAHDDVTRVGLRSGGAAGAGDAGGAAVAATPAAARQESEREGPTQVQAGGGWAAVFASIRSGVRLRPTGPQRRGGPAAVLAELQAVQRQRARGAEAGASERERLLAEIRRGAMLRKTHGSAPTAAAVERPSAPPMQAPVRSRPVPVVPTAPPMPSEMNEQRRVVPPLPAGASAHEQLLAAIRQGVALRKTRDDSRKVTPPVPPVLSEAVRRKLAGQNVGSLPWWRSPEPVTGRASASATVSVPAVPHQRLLAEIRQGVVLRKTRGAVPPPAPPLPEAVQRKLTGGRGLPRQNGGSPPPPPPLPVAVPLGWQPARPLAAPAALPLSDTESEGSSWDMV